jgi:hypothetical protein
MAALFHGQGGKPEADQDRTPSPVSIVFASPDSAPQVRGAIRSLPPRTGVAGASSSASRS